jgi:hypothetical protein
VIKKQKHDKIERRKEESYKAREKYKDYRIYGKKEKKEYGGEGEDVHTDMESKA